MPTTVNLYAIGVWFCVGFFAGLGWSLAGVLVSRLFARI